MESSIEQRLNHWLQEFLYLPGDQNANLQLKVRYWKYVAQGSVTMPIAGLILWLFKLPTAAMGIWLFALIGLVIFIVFTWVHNYVQIFALITHYYFVFFSLAAVLFFGGIMYSGGLVMVGLAGALHSITFQNKRQIRTIFAVYILTVIVEVILQPFLTPVDEITPKVNLILFVVHLLMITVVLYDVLSKFIEQQIKTNEEEARNLKEIDLMKTQFYTNISHEFRTPLTIILGMAQQAHSNPKKFLDKGLRLIKKNAHHLMNLVNQMLDLSKLEAGHVELNLIQNDIVPYLNVLLEPFQYLASQKQIGFHVLVDEDEIWMDYDKKNIEIVVTNLVTNALKNSDQGDEVFVLVGRSNRKAMMFDNMYSPLRNKKEYLLKGSDEYLQIIVKDTGRGIAKMDLHNIFERFYQVEKDVRFSVEGSGVGLVIVKELTRLMQGDILVKSKPGVGSEFILILPLTTDAPRVYKANDVKSGSNEILIQEDAQGLDKQSKKIPQLLIIEDFPDMVDYIKSFVETEFQVQVASDGDQGIKKALELIPDLIITDVMMPGKDGYEVCKQLKNDIRTCHIPIIMLTAKANEASKIKGYRQGADAYITKPFNAEELKIRLQNLIESRKKLQEKYRRIIMLGQLKNEDPTHPDEKFLNDLISILSKKFSEEDFGVQEFTREIGMSRVQLYRKLKAITGLSASDFIRSYRLNIAKEMIPKSGLNISEIAYEVGFKDPAYFTRAFKKEFGYAPSSIKND